MITVGPRLISTIAEQVMDRMYLADPDCPEYIDAFIRQMRREFRKPKRSWWKRMWSK